MSDTGGATSPTPGMSDSEGVGGVGGRTTSASGLSRTSGTSRTSMTSSAPTTTISTIAVQSGNTRIVIALLQSAEWLELRVVELTPGMVYLGATLEEASQLQRAHEEVLAKLQSKQSPVEDLLNQADQLISTQRPRAEVYAAMAESLGLAWKDLNQQLETRKEILDMGVAFHSRARQYSDSMDAAERAYTDNVMPNDAEGARQLLSALHDHKRTILEASMYTLQEAQALLARLRGLAVEGATLDSRPLHIKTNIEFSCSQIEHYLESLHDRRRFLDGLFSARKHHLEQCLALCLLYQDLTEAVTALKQLRDEVSDQQGLGESQGNAEILLHEHIKRQSSAKEIQDRCIMLLKKAEKMASSGHYAGLEARSRSYSVLEAATALHETCDTRSALLQQSILFFKLAQTALTKLDQAEVQVAGLGGEGAQRLSLVVGVVEEAIQPALAEGYAILEVTGGRNQPHNMGISLVVEELERRRSHLSSVCVASTEQVLQRTELSNAFLERYNTIESWLVRIGDAFLQGHQDPGGSLSLAKDFLHLHQTLNHDVMEKKNEIDALASFLEALLSELSEEDGNNYKDKMQALIDHWTALKKLLDIRIAITEKYVKFHEDAEAVSNEHESLELLLKDAHGEDRRDEVEAKWEQVQKLYLDLCNFGKAFCQDVRNALDPYLDSNRAVLCVENILEQLGKRRLVITDLHSHFHMKITTTKEMLTTWNTYRDNVLKMKNEMSRLEDDFCPLLRGNASDPEGVASTLEERLIAYVAAVKKTQDDIQNMMTRAEVMSYKGDQGGARDEVIGSLLQLYQSLQNKATEYQILGHMLIQWCKNIAEIHRSCDKLESQFGRVSLDIGGVEGQILEHEASKQAVLELLKFAQNEADSIITKIREQCPADAGAQDISIIEDMLKRRGKIFETVWIQHQHLLERQLKRSQYHVDLQVISDQLRDLSEQLTRMRGHYGDSLAAATNMQSAFRQFQFTVEMLERRIQTFVSTTVKMLGPEDDSGEVQLELAELEKKWSTFQMQVGQSHKSIELSIDFFKLVEEAEDWFKQGSKLLVAVAGDSANIQTPEEAERLRSRIEIFLQPGQDVQQERINKISSLAFELYGDTAPKQTEVVSLQHTHMIESFTIINRNLTMMVENLRTAEEHRENQKREKEELAASLAAAQAEAEAARLAAAAAEEARKAAEEVARTMAIPVEPIVPERVEIEIQTEAVPLPPEEEPPRQDDLPPPKKVKLIDDEPQPMAPVFLTPLVGATVTEGVKFTFECRVIGFPMPEVEWLKDSMGISANLDYKTSFEEGVCCLTIEETFTEDSALFTCKAVNAAGIAETSAILTVKEAEVVEVMAPPKFTKQLVDSTAQEGSSYQLEATVEGHPLPVVSWAKDGSCVDESPDYVITYNNGECMLRFEEVFLEDQAEYSCRATNNLGEDTTQAKLTVAAVELSERPKLIMPLSNVMARAGQKFKLECHLIGTPTPTIAWFHNNKPVKETPDCKINFDGKVATLVMSEAFPKNAGTYTIVAKNSAGEAQCSANVSVKGRIPTETSDSEVTSDIDVEPIKPTIQLPLKDTSIKEGKTARLDCVIVGQPEPEVIWYHDDTPVKESSDFKLLFHGDRCSLVIQEAFLEDAGIYRVVAMNSAGEASTACFLNVEPEPELAPPKTEPPAVAPRFSQLMTDSHVTEGQAVTLSATVSGQPTPTIAWFREGLPLIPDNELQIHEDADGHVSAHIFAATLDHTGQYEIVASNCAGTAKCVAYLSIEPRLPTPPVSSEPQEPPVFIKPLVDASVTSGSGVKFEAEVTGQPMPTVSSSTHSMDNLPLFLNNFSKSASFADRHDYKAEQGHFSVTVTPDHFNTICEENCKLHQQGSDTNEDVRTYVTLSVLGKNSFADNQYEQMQHSLLRAQDCSAACCDENSTVYDQKGFNEQEGTTCENISEVRRENFEGCYDQNDNKCNDNQFSLPFISSQSTIICKQNIKLQQPGDTEKESYDCFNLLKRKEFVSYEDQLENKYDEEQFWLPLAPVYSFARCEDNSELHQQNGYSEEEVIVCSSLSDSQKSNIACCEGQLDKISHQEQLSSSILPMSSTTSCEQNNALDQQSVNNEEGGRIFCVSGKEVIDDHDDLLEIKPDQDQHLMPDTPIPTTASSEEKSKLLKQNYDNEERQKICESSSVLDKEYFANLMSNIFKVKVLPAVEENNNETTTDSHVDEDDDFSQLSKFKNLKVLDLDTYSHFMMQNLVVYGTLDAAEDATKCFDQFHKFENIKVMDASEYADIIVDGYDSDKESSVDLDNDTDGEDDGNMHCNVAVTNKDNNAAKFLDTGLGQGIQPVKLADLWNLIKDSLPSPEEQPENNITKGKDEDHKKSNINSESEAESGYYSGNFTSASESAESSSPASKQSRSVISSAESSKRSSFCDTPPLNSSGNSVLRTEHDFEGELLNYLSKVSLGMADDNPTRHQSFIKLPKIVNDVHMLVNKELSPLSECSPESDSDSGADLLGSIHDENKSGRSRIVNADSHKTTVYQKERLFSHSLYTKSSKESMWRSCEADIGHFLNPVIDHEGNHLRCSSALSVISEESITSDCEEGSNPGNHKLARHHEISNVVTQYGNKKGNPKHESDAKSNNSAGNTNNDPEGSLTQKSVTSNGNGNGKGNGNGNGSGDDNGKTPSNNKDEERRARRATRLAKLRELTKILRGPSKLSESVANECTVNAKIVHSNPLAESATYVNTGTKSSSQDVLYESSDFSNAIQSDLLNTNECAKNASTSPSKKALLLFVEITQKISKIEFMRIIVDKLKAVVKAGQSLIRAFIFPMSEASIIDITDPLFLQQEFDNLPTDEIQDMNLEANFLSPKDNGVSVHEESGVNMATSALIEAGCYFIILCYNESPDI